MSVTGRTDCRIIDAVKVKLHNRRVMVFLLNDGSYAFKFKRLAEGIPVTESLRLSNEATEAMVSCLCELRSPRRKAERQGK